MDKHPVLCDLDGVIWLSHELIAGSVEAIARLRAAGHRVLFVTNNSFARVAEQEAALGAVGIEAIGDVLTSALAWFNEPRAGGPGIREALERRGAVIVEAEPCDVVMVGFHRDFDYEAMRRASTAARNGARLVGTNDDATYPTPNGPIPGGGAILAGVVTAAGVPAAIAGKPHEPMARLVRAEVGDAAALAAVMVGDRPETDGLFARTLGCRYAQVWSGVMARGSVIEPTPDLSADALIGIAEQLGA